LSGSARRLEVGELDFVFEASRWAFAERQAASIAAHWARLRKAKPLLFNGRMLLLGRRAIETRFDGMLMLKGVYFETNYADFVAWEEFCFPGEPVEVVSRWLRCAPPTGFLARRMAPHTFNAGQIYFPSGTPDPSDLFEGRVDLEASVRRELFEETGMEAGETTMATGWTLMFAPRRIACMKLMTLAIPAASAKERIDAYLASDPHAEFSRMHIVRSARDIDKSRVPAFVAEYLRDVLA
jgi:8-oxo-dGTP pyrophosphatase MutT (NUDIX family)